MNLLVMSTFTMGLKYCLPDLLNLKLYFSSLTPFFWSESLRLAHPGGGVEGVVLTCISGRMHYLYILFGILHKNVFFLFTQSFIHSFTQSFISVGTHVYLCYIFSYNPIPLCLFCCSNCLSFCWFCSVAQSCLSLCDPMDCSTPGFPVLHCLLEFA